MLQRYQVYLFCSIPQMGGDCIAPPPIWGYLIDMKKKSGGIDVFLLSLQSQMRLVSDMKRYIFFSFLFVLTGVLRAEYMDHRNRHVDSLECVLQSGSTLSDEELIAIYKDLMWGYMQTNGEKTREYAEKALEMSRRHKDWVYSECDALRILGINAYGMNDYERALEYYMEALNVAERMHGQYKESSVDDVMSSLYGSIGNLYNMQDQVHLAIEYYQKALPLFEKHGWVESATILYNNVAELYNSMGNNEMAERNWNRALETAEASGDEGMIALPHKGLGCKYTAAGRYDDAEPHLTAAYSYYSKNKDEENDAYIEIITAMGRVRLNKFGDVAGALQYVQEAVSRLDEEVGKEIVAGVYNLCCEIAMDRKQWRKAQEYAQRAIDADGKETYDDLGTYVWLAQIYSELGEKEKTKQTVVHIYNSMEHFATAHYQQGISEMEVVYEAEKKQAEIERLEKKREWLTTVIVLLGVIVTVILIMIMLLYHIWKQRRHNAVVQAQLQGEIAERVRISRDLHDRLGGLLTAIKLQEPEGTRTAQLTDEAIQEMRNVAHHLLPDSLRRYGLETALREYCTTLRIVQFTMTGSYTSMEKEDVIYCIVYELINNALKHAHAQHIMVEMLQGEESLAVRVSDDGCGFSPSDEQPGQGLRNVRERVGSLQGKIDIVSQTGKGTEILVEIPRTKN